MESSDNITSTPSGNPVRSDEDKIRVHLYLIEQSIASLHELGAIDRLSETSLVVEVHGVKVDPTFSLKDKLSNAATSTGNIAKETGYAIKGMAVASGSGIVKAGTAVKDGAKSVFESISSGFHSLAERGRGDKAVNPSSSTNHPKP